MYKYECDHCGSPLVDSLVKEIQEEAYKHLEMPCYNCGRVINVSAIVLAADLKVKKEKPMRFMGRVEMVCPDYSCKKHNTCCCSSAYKDDDTVMITPDIAAFVLGDQMRYFCSSVEIEKQGDK